MAHKEIIKIQKKNTAKINNVQHHTRIITLPKSMVEKLGWDKISYLEAKLAKNGINLKGVN